MNLFMFLTISGIFTIIIGFLIIFLIRYSISAGLIYISKIDYKWKNTVSTARNFNARIFRFRVKVIIKKSFYYVKQKRLSKYLILHPRKNFWAIIFILFVFSLFLFYNNNTPPFFLTLNNIILGITFIFISFGVIIFNYSNPVHAYSTIFIMSLFPVYSVFDISKFEINISEYSIVTLFCFLCFLVFASIVVFKSMQTMKSNIGKLLFTLPICTFVYLIGGVVFGVYDYVTFNSEYANVDYIKVLNYLLSLKDHSCINLLKKLWNFSKIGLEGFFSYPANNIRCTMTIIQYFIGKYIEMVLLALIVSSLIEIASDKSNS